jgi:hypothetical protein
MTRLINSEEFYRDLGRKAGRAMRQGDAGMYRQIRDLFFQRARDLEGKEWRGHIVAAYESGYAETGKVRS